MWFILSFRVGSHGPVFCSRLARAPSELDWNVGMIDATPLPEDLIVFSSAWPNRSSSASRAMGKEFDPVQDGQVSGRVAPRRSA